MTARGSRLSVTMATISMEMAAVQTVVSKPATTAPEVHLLQKTRVRLINLHLWS